MSYKLDTRDSAWLSNNKPPNVGPGSYEGANTTQNTWNRVKSREGAIAEPRSSVYGESDLRSTNNVPFNSKISRDEHQRLSK